MTYYSDLINDTKRVSAFRKAIKEISHGIVYDLGTGSGILAIFAADNADKVYAIEQNPFILKHTKKNFSKYNNIKLVEADACDYVFPESPDLIICEMLDTALIDEEQVPVINNAIEYKKDSTIFLPKGVSTSLELVSTNINHITYYENNLPFYKKLSGKIIYHDVDFSEKINDIVEKLISTTVISDGLVNAIKLTTYTILTDEIIVEPTPMLNPPLLIPVNEIDVKKGDLIQIKLKYIMGRGLNTIQTSIKRIK